MRKILTFALLYSGVFVEFFLEITLIRPYLFFVLSSLISPSFFIFISLCRRLALIFS